MILRINRYLLPIFLLPSGLCAQEVMIGMDSNPVAAAFWQNYPSLKKAEPADTLELPFFDDFSDSWVVPHPKRWSDNDVFINSKYPVNPVSVGVATMDALRFDGSHYPDAGRFPYKTDILTSKPLNLNFPASDSVYLSFFFQPKGLGEMPDKQDSLALEFYSPSLARWTKVWSVPGDSLRAFRQVMIPVKDPLYLEKGFRFRFFNLCSQSENNDYPDLKVNVDHWHIDYVRLDRSRTLSDTILRDVAFTDPLRSILKDYETIPWRHFPSAYNTQREPFIRVLFQNHDTLVRNVTKELFITDLLNPYIYNPIPTANDVSPTEKVSFLYGYDYPFNFGSGDSASFLIRTILRTDIVDKKQNDTLRHIQHFSNYYSYDDGTAEAGYGLRGQGTKNASAAVRFNSFIPDTLRAIDMYFNQVIDSLNLNYYFYLNVWGDQNGKPGEILYSELGVRPAYSDSLHRFVRYYLKEPLAVNNTFYVGWTNTVEFLLNIGLDLNRNSSSRNFVNLGMGWENSKFPASIMIRPVLSLSPLKTDAGPSVHSKPEIIVYPNPASETVYISLPDFAGDLRLNMYDIQGRKVLSESLMNAEGLNLSPLPEGLYIIVLEGKGFRHTQKLVIRR